MLDHGVDVLPFFRGDCRRDVLESFRQALHSHCGSLGVTGIDKGVDQSAQALGEAGGRVGGVVAGPCKLPVQSRGRIPRPARRCGSGLAAAATTSMSCPASCRTPRAAARERSSPGSP